MPELNPRRERFCRIYQKTGNATLSYARAYMRPRDPVTRALASRLLTFENVQRRLKDMSEDVIRKHNVTIDSLVNDLERAETLARELKQPNVLVQATVAKARITGNIIEKREAGKPGDFASLQDAGDVLAAVRRELGDEAADAIAKVLERATARQAFERSADDVNNIPLTEQ